MTFRMPHIAIAIAGLGLLALLPVLGQVSTSNARAQEPGNTAPKKDDALDDLLKDLDKEKNAAAAPKSETKPTPKPSETKPTAKLGEAKPKPPAEVKDKDKDLDALLEKLGETEDKPTPENPKGGGNTPPPPPEADDKPADDANSPKPETGKDGKAKPDPLTGKAKDLDEHLSDLSGQRRKKKSGQDQEGTGPLGEVVKEMRDVEQRLGKTDTGEATRKKQQTIVKNLETLIEQMKAQSSRSQQKKQQRITMKPGDKPGDQNSETPGNTGGNAPFAKPEKPTDKRALANSKDAWGHLPPELRQEMENVFKEEPLPAREELIRRYYLSVSKKSLNRGSR